MGSVDQMTVVTELGLDRRERAMQIEGVYGINEQK